MRLKPIGTKVVVVKVKDKPISDTIWLDETVTERETGFAKVVAAGTNVLDVSPGDVVILPPYIGAVWEDDGVEYHIIEANQIEAVQREGYDG